MVLSLMRKHAKSWLIKFLIGIIAVVFVFYFGYSFTATRGLKIAYVNGELINEAEYEKAYRELVEGMRRQYQSMWDDDLIEKLNMKQQALEGLINQKLISQEARKLGLDITESENQKAIMDYPAFQVGGRFDIRRYKAILGQNRMKPEDFEVSMALQLLDAKLRQFLFSFLEVPENAVLEYYTFNNEKIKLGFVHFNPEKFEKSVTVDQAAMEKFFKKHQEQYRVPEKIKLTYMEIDPDGFKEKVTITDGEIESYYEYNPDMFVERKQVKARHILFKLEKDADEATEKKVREEAEAVLKEARQGKDFAELAKKHSQGPSKSEGGDLGYFSEGQMEKAFEEAAFKMKKDEVSDLVRSFFGYHIIKVEDVKEKRTKPLEEVREQIREVLISGATGELAHEKGLSIMDQMPYDVELDQYAPQHKLETKDTGHFASGEPIPGISRSEEKGNPLFSLDVKETSELIELNGKFYIFQLVEKKPSHLPDLKDVAKKVKEDYTKYLLYEKANEAAKSYLEDLRKGKPWEELAKEKQMEISDTGYFTRNEPTPKIGYLAALTETAFKLNKDKRYPDTVFESSKGAFVIRWEGEEGIDKKTYEQEKEKYRFSLRQARQKRVFQNWLQNLRKNAEIEIVTPVSG